VTDLKVPAIQQYLSRHPAVLYKELSGSTQPIGYQAFCMATMSIQKQEDFCLFKKFNKMVKPLGKKHISFCIQPHECNFQYYPPNILYIWGNKLQHHQQKRSRASYPQIIIINLYNKPYVSNDSICVQVQIRLLNCKLIYQ
jgi:hypothetical protein